ncbi:MAG: hypothetical protein V4502_08380 [Pseudomonadota bacterium]
MKIRLGYILGAGAALMATPALAHHYYITAHNHFGEAVYFSCNGSAPREIHIDGQRQIVVDGPSHVNVACMATHDGQQVWHDHVDMGHEAPYTSFTIAPSQHNDGD